MNFVKSLGAVALAGALLPASAATVYDFQTVSAPDLGSSIACTDGDRCANAAGGTMTFFGGAVGATGYHLTDNATSMLDNFSNRPTSDLKWVGLGVYHLAGPTNSDDNITKDERLVLTFGSAVLLTDVFLRAEGHFADFSSGAQFGVSSGAGPQVNFSFTSGTNNYSIGDSQLTMSNTWTFYGLSDETMKQYYVSSVTAVPEPEAYGLALAGMGVVGFMLRRRKQNA